MSRHLIKQMLALPVLSGGLILIMITPITVFFNRMDGVKANITSDSRLELIYDDVWPGKDNSSEFVENSAVAEQSTPVATEWRDVCVPRRLEITGKGMGDGDNSETR